MGSCFSCCRDQNTQDAPPPRATASPEGQQGPSPDPAPGPPTKKALLIGIRYENGRWPTTRPNQAMNLGEVTHREVQTWHDILIQHYDYREGEIICMRDTGQCSRDSDLWPNEDNILAQLEDLVRDVRNGDQRFLFIAGHGGQLSSTSDDTEIDSMDEILYTLERDGETCHTIKDNDLYRILADSLPPGANLTAVLELCNSGTLMDLPFRLTRSESGSPTLTDAKSRPQGLQGNILCLSACEDWQQAHHFEDTSNEQGILTTLIRSTLEAAKVKSQAPMIQIMGLLDGLVEACNQLRGDRPPQTPMVTIGRRLAQNELENLIFQP